MTALAFLAFFGDLAAKEATKAAFKRLIKSKLADNLTAELKEWAEELPEEYGEVEPSFLTDLTFGKKGLPPQAIGPANAAVLDQLGHLAIPSRQLWYQALEERREDAGEVLRANPQSLGKRNALYLKDPEVVADLLEDAAERLRLVCLKDPVLAPAATYNLVEQVQSMLKDSEARNQLIPAHPSQTPKKPWALEHFVKAATTLAVSGNPVVSRGEWVVAVFQAKPSGAWKDPYAAIEGSWDEEKHEIQLFSGKPLRGVLPGGQTIAIAGTGLCIPSYQVDVEWREQTLVHGPLWGAVKRTLVSRFLQFCLGKQMICRIVYIDRAGNGTFHLFSADYDDYLLDQWAYYKGLEAALSTNDVYKRYLSESDLQKIVREKLMAKVTKESVPERYRPAFANRAIDQDDLALVLRGLMERYRLSQMGRPDVRRKQPPRKK